MKHYFFAKVLSYEDDMDKYYIDTVCGFASDFAEAAGKVEDYFRSSLIKIESLELLEQCSSEIFLVPEEIKAQYEKEDWLAYSKECNEDGVIIDG